jgi:DNA-binding transcriptional MocR family regulator
MLAVDKSSSDFLYRQVIDLIAANIETGTLRPGDRLPSLRRMSKRIGVSVPTVRQAYVRLEDSVGWNPGRSQFYVRGARLNDLVRAAPVSPQCQAITGSRTSLMDRVCMTDCTSPM